jgi:hypothetical protein
MEPLGLLEWVSLAAALGWASGFRLYAVLFLTGLVGYAGWLELPTHLHVLAHPLVLVASGDMALIEFVADKVPWFDSLWDTVHTFIRIPAGALLAAGVFGDAGTAPALAAALVGGTLAASSHLAKAGTRVIVNTSPEPASNWGLSFGEDALVSGGLLLALTHPMLFLSLLLAFLLVLVWLLPRLWKAARQVLSRLAAPRIAIGNRP